MKNHNLVHNNTYVHLSALHITARFGVQKTTLGQKCLKIARESYSHVSPKARESNPASTADQT